MKDLLQNINTILWDWNGTLLDDTDICIDSMNIMLRKRNLKTISKSYYRNVFTFPVKDYYEKIGFDFTIESFENVAVEYIDIYTEKLKSCLLFKGVENVLSSFQKNNFKQYILSAMEQNSLVKSVDERGIKKYFQKISGLENVYANGKIHNAKKLIEENNIDPSKMCLIGDTIHDHEVAQALNCKCILISAGHQSAERLNELEITVVDDIKSVCGM